MLYIVRTDNFAFDPTIPPQQAAGLIENMVIPTAERLIQLKSEGKVLVAGTPPGHKSVYFVADAASHDEISQLVDSLPLWPIHQWEITPLVDIEDHLGIIRELLAHLKSL